MGRHKTSLKSAGKPLRPASARSLDDGGAERYRSTFEQAEVGIAHTTTDGHFLEVNQRLCQLLGYTSAELRALSTRELTHPDERGEQTALRMELIAGKREKYSGEKRYLRKDGTIVWVNRTVTLAHAAPNAAPYLIQTIEDITERKLAEEKFERLTRARRVLAECNHAQVHAANEAGLLNEMCRIAVESGGYRQAWIGVPAGDFLRRVSPAASAGYDSSAPMRTDVNWSPDGRYQGLAGDALESGEPCILRDILNDPRHAPKRKRAVELGYQSSIALPLKVEGTVIGVLVLHASERDAFDVDEMILLRDLADDVAFGIAALRSQVARQQAEQGLRDSEQRVREVFDQAAVGIIRADLNGILVEVNQKFCEMLGYSRHELLGKAIRDITHPDDYGEGAKLREEAQSGAQVAHLVGEKRFQRKDGTALWTKRTLSAAYDDMGRAKYVTSVIEDITQQKDLELRYRDTFDQAAVGIAHFDLQHRNIKANRRYGEIVGYTPDELLGKPPGYLNHPDDVGMGSEQRGQLLSGAIDRYTQDKRYVRKDGTVIWVRRTESLARDASGAPQFYIRVIEDITARMAAESERARLAAIVANSNDAIIGRSLDGTITSWNVGATRIFGYSEKEMIGQAITVLVPEGHRHLTDNSERLRRGDPIPASERVRVTKDGRVIHVLSSISPIKNEAGEVVGAAVIVRDISERKQAEERYRATFDNAPIGIMHTAIEDDSILHANSKLCEMTGYTPDELRGMVTDDLISREMAGVDRAKYREKMLNGEINVFSSERTFRRKDGSTFWVNRTVSLARDAAGGPLYFIRIIEDITGRKELEQRYRDSFDQVGVGIVHTSEDGRYLRVNQKFCEMLGYAEPELIGREAAGFTHPDDREKSQERRLQLWHGKIDKIVEEKRYIRKDGSAIWTNRTVSMARDASGKPLYFIRVIEDITDRKSVEERYRATFDNAPVGIMHTSLDGYEILRANRKLCEMLGYTRDELLGMTSTDVVHPDYRFSDKSRYGDQLLNGEIQSFASERKFVRKDGSSLWVNRTVSLVRDAAGEPEYFIRVVEDISKRKEAEEAVAHERALLRTVVDAVPERIYAKDREGRFILQNATNTRAHGASSPEELLGKTLFDIFPRETAERIEAEDRAMIASGKPVIDRERPSTDAAGETRWVVSSKIPLRDTAGEVTAIVGVSRDITERKRMEEALRQNVERFEIAARATNDVIWDWNLGTNSLWWGEGFRALFGYRGEEIEPGIESWYNRIHPADRERVTGAIHKVIESGGTSWADEYRFRRADGSYADIYDRGFLIQDATGKPVRMIGAMMDVTERTVAAHRRSMEHAVTKVLAEAGSVDEVMPLLIKTMCEAMEWTYGARWVWNDAEQNLMRCEFWSDFDLDFGGEDETPWLKVRFSTPGGLLRRAWFEKQPTWIADIEREEGFSRRSTALKFGLHSAFSFPIISGTKTVGVMEFFGPKVRQPDEMLVQISGSIGRQIGQFIQRKQAEEARRQSEEQFRQLAGNIPQAFWMTDTEQKELIYVSPAFEVISGQPVDEVKANPRSWLDAVHAEDRERVKTARRGAVEGKYDETFRLVRPDGTIRWIHDRAFPVQDETGYVYRIAGIAEDVTERKLAEEQLMNLAHFDILTGLPNRVLFYDRLKQSLAQAKRNQWNVGVMFIDVDRFKNVNDTLGHAMGDRLLQQITQRLTGAVRADDTVGRLGGDEFAIVLSHLSSAQDANLVAQKIMASFNEPFKLDGAEVFVTGSLGITLFPVDSADQDTLIKNADAAMYRAKELGRNGYQFYTPEMNARALELLGMESSLRRALDRGEFQLHYQPKANVATGEIVGIEALLRWNHPERGMVPPAAFIPVMEETGLIVRAGEWVLKAVCEQLQAWQAAGFKPVPVAVNLSARQFLAKDLGATIKRTLETHRIDPALIELEITESSLMSNTQEAITTLEYLSGLGVSVSVDDFGTGYSSLAYLKRFPLDTLKIDRSFVSDITTDADDANITRAIISMAHSLGLKVIAEGVETEAQAAFLADHGCDQIQGYFLTPALAPDDYVAWLSRRGAPGRSLAASDSRPAVLLVDDEEITLVLAMRALGKDGYQVHTAKNAHDAFKVLNEHRVDVVISDHLMPGISGIDFLARVKSEFPHIVRMMMSGSSDLKTAAEATSRAEVFRFLPKGVSDERLRVEVGDAVRARGMAAGDRAGSGGMPAK